MLKTPHYVGRFFVLSTANNDAVIRIMNIRIPSIVSQMSKELFSIAPNHLESFMLAAIFPDDGVEMPTAKLEQLGQSDSKVNIIPVQGVLLNESNVKHGIYGYQAMTKDFIAGENAPNVVAHLFMINSPGGSVNQLAEFADMVFAAKKPTYAFINGLSASAAYYIAAACGHIMTTTRSSIVGNIGSKISTIDMMGILENFGAKRIEAYGDTAVDKDLGFADAKAGDLTKLKTILVNPANDMFVADVGRYRPAVTDQYKTGSIYYSEAALENKLVDSLGNVQDLLDKISNDLSINNTTQMSNKVTMLVPSALVGGLKLMGASVVETTDEAPGAPTANANENQGPEATAQAAASEAETVNPLQAKVTELTNQLADKTTELDKKNEEVASMKTLNEALLNNPAAQRSASRKEGNEDAPEAPEALNEDDVVMTKASEYDVH